ncbi:hypothetical protein OKW21_005099 [Catalinimonas alkaloidigena]|uniref:hypothetical protein n=1 Tax=Catalinimonas alkaloidigena TaxID=1075417 RepID=UPI002406FA05|nr:hypothetical protein [Catalinimonas alkaloidigena]MDF9799836.1 hypothetical protein [Catalinimonas alkaloidigena]
MVIHAPQLLQVITGNFARAITLYPFVFVRHERDRNDPILLNHERIHLRQQRELLVFPFYLCYLLEYGIGRLKGRTHRQAYEQISFEREAHIHERDFTYLKKRKLMAFRNYYGRKLT